MQMPRGKSCRKREEQHHLVDSAAVSVERTLTSRLLATVDDHSDVHPLPDLAVLPKSNIAGRDRLRLILESLSDRIAFGGSLGFLTLILEVC
jgi:hypothetical protein